MGNLDLKKLSKGMNINDKMKLLFEDSNKAAETDGKEHVLTPQERDAIVEDARKTGEIREIRRVNELYLLSNYISIDMDIANLSFLLSITSLEKSLMGVLLKGAADEIVDQMIYDMARQKSVKEDEIEKEEEELRKKYKLDGLFKGFDLFDPQIKDDSIFPEGLKNAELQPNPDIQRFFIISFKHAKKLKKKLFEMDYVVRKAPIDFLPEQNKSLIKECEELIRSFTSLDQSLRMLRIYRDYGEAFINLAKLNNPEFLNIVKNLPTKMELTDVEKQELQDRIDKHMNENL